ncbi:polymorphic toxin-type HINT domain-containing protein [Streptomyces goshikiensis]|uniref:polymorphic toxin-type HINT domain-containing protein n=1 Tax=Streptomyces goshikiensis TaxID=1942 RepID=UPI00366540A3
MLSSLVAATPVSAAEPTLSDRGRVLEYWTTGGPALKASAGSALTGSDAGVKEFLEKGRAVAENLDDREAALQVVSEGGPALRKAAEQALNGTPEQLDVFLKEGWKSPLDQDQRVEAARVGEAGGPGVKKAADAALEGNIEAVRKFLSEEQYAKRDADARVRVAQIESVAGPKARAAAAAALDGTIDDIREFLAVGQHVARAQDQEYATVSQLAQQAKNAGEQAERENTAAKEASERAVSLALLAKEETEKAKVAAANAKNDAIKAADAARRAAEATRRAAEAAKAAISAARAANAAAQVAAAAASSAAKAAAGAANAAAAALTSATSGKRDEQIAAQAEQVAAAAEDAANFADRAAIAGDAAARAAQAAASSTANANATAAAADETGAFAEQAGVSSAEAREAAATARRYAGEATRAADRSSAYAAEAASEARTARDAARSAARNARAAAQAARNAGQHAAGSQAAANESKAHADEALKRANEAVEAVNQAKKVYELARKAEDEELVTRTTATIDRAKDLKADYTKSQAQIQKAKDDTGNLEAELDRLADQTSQPGVDTAAVAAAGRKMALASLQVRGTWSKSAAASVLAAPDSTVVEYVRNGWRSAEAQDDRGRVRTLVAESPYAAVRTAAQAALEGDAAQLRAFVTSGQHAAAAPDYRVEVARIAEAGGPAVKKAADAAYDAHTPQALVDFLTKHQYSARESDERVVAARLAENAGPEVKAAAEAALEGPTTLLHSFVESGQYRSARADQTNTTHKAQILAIIAESGKVGAEAQRHAAEALKTAAIALNASSDADKYRREAEGYAKDADTYAAQALTSANQADDSAKAAAVSARTARNAEQQAHASARSAGTSAAFAETQASLAQGYAAEAYAAAEAARQSAINAGQSSHAADTIYRTYVAEYLEQKARVAEQQWWEKTYDKFDQYLTAGKEFYGDILHWYMGLSTEEKLRLSLEFTHLGLDVLGLVPGFGEPADLINCGLYAGEGWYFDESDKYIDAALSCGAAIPIAGYAADAVKAYRWYKKGEKVWEGINSFRKNRKDLDDLMPPCPTAKHSFPKDTPVLMGDGSTRPIQEIRTGDLVLATDPETGSTAGRRVDATIYTPDDRNFTGITLREEDGGGAITTTDHHPFWSVNDQRWQNAADLKTGDSLRTPDGGTVEVGQVAHWSELQPAYDLTVNDLHTYYVLAEKTPVLVHNCGNLDYDNGVQGGHAKRDHVGKTDQELIDRARREGNEISSLDAATAQDTVTEIVNSRRSEINTFGARCAPGTEKDLPVHQFNRRIGRVANPQGAVRDATSLKLVLKCVNNPTGNHRGKWIVYTMKAS